MFADFSRASLQVLFSAFAELFYLASKTSLLTILVSAGYFLIMFFLHLEGQNFVAILAWLSLGLISKISKALHLRLAFYLILLFYSFLTLSSAL